MHESGNTKLHQKAQETMTDAAGTDVAYSHCHKQHSKMVCVDIHNSLIPWTVSSYCRCMATTCWLADNITVVDNSDSVHDDNPVSLSVCV